MHGGDKQATQLWGILQNPNITAGQAATAWRNLYERPEAWACTGVATQADRYAATHNVNDVDINHAGVNVTINGNITTGVLAGVQSVLEDDKKNLELRMRSPVEGKSFR